MSNAKETGCMYCDFADIEIMRNNGYVEDKYTFCEIHNSIVEVIENCPSCVATHIKEKREANMNFLIERMAAALDDYK